jgi:hypothetical protein
MIPAQGSPPERPGAPQTNYSDNHYRVRRTGNGPASTRPTPVAVAAASPNGLPVASF